MSERLHVCQALASMVRQTAEPTEEEITFVGMAALQLGLTSEEHEQVQRVLKDGGDFDQHLREITSRPMRVFLLRRVLAAALLDSKVTEAEQSLIERTLTAFGLDTQRVADALAWTRVAIEVERQLESVLADLA